MSFDNIDVGGQNVGLLQGQSGLQNGLGLPLSDNGVAEVGAFELAGGHHFRQLGGGRDGGFQLLWVWSARIATESVLRRSCAPPFERDC